MPKGVRKDYCKEYKIAAVYLMKSGVMKPKEIFELLGGIDRQTVYRWIQEYDKYGEAAFDGKPLSDPELEQLHQENAELREENEILKRAEAFFKKSAH